MSTVTTLIQPSEIINAGIVKAAPLNSRFDAQLLSPWVYFAESRFLLQPKSFMCQEFYDDLIAQKNATPSNYNAALGPLVQAYPTNAEYEALWTQYLLPYLSLCVFYTALPYINKQTGSNGSYFNDSQYATQVRLEGSRTLQDETLQNINDAKARLVKFLCDNSEDYPLFCTDGVCKDCCDDCKKHGKECAKHGNVYQEGRDLGMIFYKSNGESKM